MSTVRDKEMRIPRAKSPGEAGISAAALAELMQDIIDSGLETHSVMVVRHGKVAYEAFRRPYAPEIPHVMFSVSKSVTSCAVGFAIAEGMLGVDDRVGTLEAGKDADIVITDGCPFELETNVVKVFIDGKVVE